MKINRGIQGFADTALLVAISLLVVGGIVFYAINRNQANESNESSLTDSSERNLGFEEAPATDDAGIPKSVKAKVNQQGYLEIVVSGGKSTNSATRRVQVEDGVKLTKDNTIKTEVVISSTDVLTTNTINPRTTITLTDKLPSGTYKIEIILTEQEGMSKNVLSQDKLTTEISIP